MVPVASVTPLAGAVITECAVPCDSATTLPGVGRFSASRSVTVTIVCADPLLNTPVGAAEMLAPVAAGTPKATFAVWDNTTPDVVSVAVNVTSSDTRSLTVKIAAPLLTDVTALAGVMVALPPDAASVTVRPCAALPRASASRTTMYAFVAPSAGTGSPADEPGGIEKFDSAYASTIDTLALVAPSVCPVRCWCSFGRFGEPRPTCAKSRAHRRGRCGMRRCPLARTAAD